MVNEKKIDIIRASKLFKLQDIIVFALVALLAVLLIIFSYSKSGETVRISYNNKVSTYPLSINREILIEDKLTVIIENGVCYVKESSCPDKICLHSGAIKRVNQTIICAPYGIIISITGGQENRI